MKYKRSDIYWFSGTGNSLLAAKMIKGVFEEEGLEVELHQMMLTDPKKVKGKSLLGLAFPVAEQGTYPFVWDFIKALPRSKGRKVFMVDTMMMFSGGIVGPVKKILDAKGYKTVGAKELKMPNNLYPKKIDPGKNDQTVVKAMKEAEEFAHAVLDGSAKWGRIPVLSDGMGYFSQADWTWNLLGKHYKMEIKKKECIKCGICEKLCPTGNIKVKKYPVMGDKCKYCMRCYSYCPRGVFHKEGKGRYKAVKVGELLGDLSERKQEKE